MTAIIDGVPPHEGKGGPEWGAKKKKSSVPDGVHFREDGGTMSPSSSHV
jgi:hypothetical protein